jgi:hypothetical protein
VAKRSDGRNLFRKAASKNSLSDLLIAASSIVEDAERSGGQLDLTTAFEHFQITNVHPPTVTVFELAVIGGSAAQPDQRNHALSHRTRRRE